MRTFILLLVCIVGSAAFDCFGQNNSCAMSHVKCDTGYAPFCEHFMGPPGFYGICTCDKKCASAADCSNIGADGCPPMSHPICDMMYKVCQCFGGPPVGPFHYKENGSV